ncbi:hypothetical protein B4167_3544 [Caldibacillus thermoamylovorans]|uniref:Uncharacterized protein n=1 Tax=Caldibacillus thermoamylovorans TaxID=35841 RepID=A0ABD4A4V5_9BACI|nr:hypothetical protein B4167_3544 [Caldibacillus thermoamylovorans]
MLLGWVACVSPLVAKVGKLRILIHQRLQILVINPIPFGFVHLKTIIISGND